VRIDGPSEEPAALEHTIEDGLCENLVVQDSSPCVHRFVRGKDHRAMPLVDDVKESVRGVKAIGEVSDFIEDEDGRMRMRGQRVGQFAGAKERTLDQELVRSGRTYDRTIGTFGRIRKTGRFMLLLG
jgi:hypothetical protein